MNSDCLLDFPINETTEMMIDSAAIKREFGSLDNNKNERPNSEEVILCALGSDNTNENDQDKDFETTTTASELPDSSRASLTTTTTSPNNNNNNKSDQPAANSNNNSRQEKIVTKVEYDEESFLDNESSSNDYQSEAGCSSYAGGDLAGQRNGSGDLLTGERARQQQNNHIHQHRNDFITTNDPQHEVQHNINNSNDNQSGSTSVSHFEEPEQMRKLFIGGLDHKTSEATLKKHFERFGDVIDCVVKRLPQSKRSRGFGFVIYASSLMVDKAQEARPHLVDGKEVQSKRAISREDSGKPETEATVKKLFLAGLSDDIEKKDLEDYFKMFGNILDINIVAFKDTGKRRGFAFVEYDDYDPVDKIVMRKFHTIKDKRIEAKKAIPKTEMDARKRGGGGGGDPRAAMAGMMALAGGSSLDSITAGGAGPSIRQRPGAGGRGGNGCGGYLWERLPYGPADYPANLDAYPSHYHYNTATNWMMDGTGGHSGGSYGLSRGAYGRNAYANHLPSWITAADYANAFPPSQGGSGGGAGAGPMRLSYQHHRFGPYGSPGYGGAGGHRGRGFNP